MPDEDGQSTDNASQQTVELDPEEYEKLQRKAKERDYLQEQLGSDQPGGSSGGSSSGNPLGLSERGMERLESEFDLPDDWGEDGVIGKLLEFLDEELGGAIQQAKQVANQQKAENARNRFRNYLEEVAEEAGANLDREEERLAVRGALAEEWEKHAGPDGNVSDESLDRIKQAVADRYQNEVDITSFSGSGSNGQETEEAEPEEITAENYKNHPLYKKMTKDDAHNQGNAR